MRRQSTASREEAAVYRAESLRLQDELRSAKARLTSALDSQEELLRKNSEKHAQIYELQNREAALRDDVASKASMVAYYQEHTQTIEAQLADLSRRAATTERTLEARILTLSDELASLRSQIATRTAEGEAQQATIEAQRAELRHKDAELMVRERELASGTLERAEVREELRSSMSRLAAVQTAQDDLRVQIALKSDQLATKEEEITHSRAAERRLHEQLVDRSSQVTDLRTNIGRLEAEKTDILASSTAQQATLDAELNVSRAKERTLAADLRVMHRYVSRRELEVRDLADELDYRDYRPYASSTALSTYYKLKAERDEADRWDALARQRRRRSLGL